MPFTAPVASYLLKNGSQGRSSTPPPPGPPLAKHLITMGDLIEIRGKYGANITLGCTRMNFYRVVSVINLV